jgi:hypothetical protein
LLSRWELVRILRYACDMPRFTIKDMMLATMLIAAGAGVLAMIFRWRGPSPPILPALITLHGACAMIGAGFFAPFHKKKLGAGIGVGLMLAFIVYLCAINPPMFSPTGPVIAPRPTNLKVLRSLPNSEIK